MSLLPSIACSLLPSSGESQINQLLTTNRVQFTRELPLWGNNAEIIVSFFDGTQPQKDVVQNAFLQYRTYVNLQFKFLENHPRDAYIRITFAGQGSGSVIGRNALEVEPENPTMNLGGIDEANPSETDRAIVLHQVGHALGLDDEWHDDAIDLVGQEENQVLAQYLRRYEERMFSNFPQRDDTSVMRYFVPRQFTRGNEGIPVNATLSDCDKAWLLVNYPGKSGDEGWNLEKAFKTFNITPESASRADPRRYYASFILGELQSYSTSVPFGVQMGEEELFLAAVLSHPSFRESIMKIVERQLREEYKSALPEDPTQQSLIWSLLFPFIWSAGGEVVDKYLSKQSDIPLTTFAAYYAQSHPPQVRYDILEWTMGILQPQVLLSSWSDVLKEGLKKIPQWYKGQEIQKGLQKQAQERGKMMAEEAKQRMRDQERKASQERMKKLREEFERWKREKEKEREREKEKEKEKEKSEVD